MAMIRSTFSLSLEAAKVMMDAAVEEALRLGVGVCVAVVDVGANLLSFMRMDDAPLLSIDIAHNKAYSAAAFGKGTHEWYPLIEKEPALLHGLTHTERLIIFGGGLPLVVEGRTIGGVGVSGGSSDQDTQCARAAVSAFNSSLAVSLRA
jgi:glc operon protein GlcG